MPDKITPSFEHQILEADIKRLTHEVMKLKEFPETRDLAGQEIVKRSLRVISGSPLGSSTQAPNPLPAYMNDSSPESKLEVEFLIDIAMHNGIDKANAEAAKSSSFVLDAFHDALAGKLYPEFQKRGILD